MQTVYLPDIKICHFLTYFVMKHIQMFLKQTAVYDLGYVWDQVGCRTVARTESARTDIFPYELWPATLKSDIRP